MGRIILRSDVSDTRRTEEIDVGTPIQVTKVSMYTTVSTALQLYFYADDKNPVYLEDETINAELHDPSSDNTYYYIGKPNHQYMETTVFDDINIIGDKIKIDTYSSELSASIVFVIDYILRPDLITVDDYLRYGKMKQVGQDQMGDASEGSQFFKTGEKKKVSSSGGA